MDHIFHVLGYDIGGTKIAICLANSNGNILASKRIVSRDRNPDEVLNEMYKTGKKLLAMTGIMKKNLRAIGIGAPSPIDIKNGLLLSPPNMKKWKKIPIRNFIADKFKVPVYFDNDANAGALAEWFFGAGRGCNNIIFLTMSTGIGGGIIIEGHLVRGKNNMAGELGHVVLDLDGPVCKCGMKGCYEAFCGGVAVADRMKKELADQPDHPIIKYAGGKLDNVDMEALLQALKNNNDYAMKLWKYLCLRHAQAIGIYINIFNPEAVILGTIAMAAGKSLINPIKNYLPDFCWLKSRRECKIIPGSLGNRLGEYSGVCVALNSLYETGQCKKP